MFDIYVVEELFATLYKLFFWAAGLLLVLCAISLIRYMKKSQKEDLLAALVVGAVAFLFIGINVFYVAPNREFDSVRYVVDLRTESNTTVILPIPEEPGLFESIKIVRGTCQMELVETEYGRGLQIVYNDTLIFRGEYISRSGRKVDYTPDLLEGDSFRVFINCSGDIEDFAIYQLRVIHQSATDFHSKQVIGHGELDEDWWALEDGWKLLHYQIRYATGDDRNNDS